MRKRLDEDEILIGDFWRGAHLPPKRKKGTEGKKLLTKSGGVEEKQCGKVLFSNAMVGFMRDVDLFICHVCVLRSCSNPFGRNSLTFLSQENIQINK